MGCPAVEHAECCPDTSLQGRGASKKKGRPIAYRGDPEAAGLSEDEKRRIKRRIANRESARRVRQKRLDLMDQQQAQVWWGDAPTRRRNPALCPLSSSDTVRVSQFSRVGPSRSRGGAQDSLT